MDVDDEEDLVPEITKAHFEEAMKFARRSVIYSLSTCSQVGSSNQVRSPNHTKIVSTIMIFVLLCSN